jgi:hypothetical protein
MMFRATKARVFLASSALILFVVLLLAVLEAKGVGWQSVAAGAATLIALLGLAETLTVQVALEADSVFISTGWRRRRIARNLVEGVTWEAGAGVALRMADGTWVNLPSTGHNSQGMTNSIRAWLRRTASAPGSQTVAAGPAAMVGK